MNPHIFDLLSWGLFGQFLAGSAKVFIGGQDFLILVAGFKDTDFWILHYAKWRYAK
jgi:hypothetical protein